MADLGFFRKGKKTKKQDETKDVAEFRNIMKPFIPHNPSKKNTGRSRAAEENATKAHVCYKYVLSTQFLF